MVTLRIEKDSVPSSGKGTAALRDVGLRVTAAVLHIAATVAVLQVLPPSAAGIFFKGFVIAYGLAALLRGKYDLFVAQHFVGRPEATRTARELVRGLGSRVVVRSIIACAILLVVTADLDVMDVYLRPYLETYLPFVLAVPFATLALFLASVLRAVNRTLSSTLVATYSINVMLLAVALGASGTDDSLLTHLSWSFFVGTVLAAGVGALMIRRVFPATTASSIQTTPTPPIQLPLVDWPEVYLACSRNGLTGLALAVLQWGPACLLAVLGTEIQFADFAAVTRTAQVIDFLIPGAIFVPHAFLLHSRLAGAIHSGRGKLLVDLLVSAATTTLSVAAVAMAAPGIVEFYGTTYSNLTGLFLSLFAAQWLNGTGRPAIRHLAAHWNQARVRRILLTSMAVAVVASLTGIPLNGAAGAALGVALGALLMNGQAIQAAFAGYRVRT